MGVVKNLITHQNKIELGVLFVIFSSLVCILRTFWSAFEKVCIVWSQNSRDFKQQSKMGLCLSFNSITDQYGTTRPFLTTYKYYSITFCTANDRWLNYYDRFLLPSKACRQHGSNYLNENFSYKYLHDIIELHIKVLSVNPTINY